jgi:CBS domain-containing protein
MIFDTRVSEVLAFKGSRHVWMLSGDASVREAVQLMREHSIGSIVVADDREVVGVVTERECLSQLDEHGYLSRSIRLREIAKVDFPVVSLGATARECFELMGLVSIGDIVRALVDDQRFTIEQLMAYLTGSYGRVSNELDLPSTALEVSSGPTLRRVMHE